MDQFAAALFFHKLLGLRTTMGATENIPEPTDMGKLTDASINGAYIYLSFSDSVYHPRIHLGKVEITISIYSITLTGGTERKESYSFYFPI